MVKTESRAMTEDQQMILPDNYSKSGDFDSLMERKRQLKTRIWKDKMQMICEVDPNCENIAENKCSETAYRGCTMYFCAEHSGISNRKRVRNVLCRLCCRTDSHEDICSECSEDIVKV